MAAVKVKITGENQSESENEASDRFVCHPKLFRKLECDIEIRGAHHEPTCRPSPGEVLPCTIRQVE